MAFTRIVMGWAAVTLLFALWSTAERRLGKPVGPAPPRALRVDLPIHAVEGLLLTLFAGLWFGSLGSGGAALLFLVVGALMEVPSRMRDRTGAGVAWKPMVAGILRIVLAGMVLGVVVG
jgi:hypothetical protein